MGFATFGIGLLPTYDHVGLWAPAALVALRLLQGIASGGEWGGGVLMISENAPPEKRGYYAAWSQLGVGGGFVLSSAAFLAVQALPHDQFISWGWRLPFLASILIFALGVYIRHNLPESRDFENAEKAGKTSHMPVLEAIKRHPKEILMAMGLRVAENGGAYLPRVLPRLRQICGHRKLDHAHWRDARDDRRNDGDARVGKTIGPYRPQAGVYDRRVVARRDGVPVLLVARHTLDTVHLACARAGHRRLSWRNDRHLACARQRTL